MSGESWNVFVLSWITRAVWAQVFAVLCLSCLVVIMLTYRKWRAYEFGRLMAQESEEIVNELLSLMEGGPAEYRLRRPRGWLSFRRMAQREALLEQMSSVSGTEREHLVSRYLGLGYGQDDLFLCRSRLWWRRLEGAVRLSNLAHPIFADELDVLRRDRNPLVNATSFLALSSLDHELNRVEMSRIKTLLADGRMTLVVAVLDNWRKRFGFEKVFEAGLEIEAGPVRDRVLSVLISHRSFEAGPLLLRLLDENGIDPGLLAEALLALRETMVFDAAPRARELLDHFDERVQIRAAEFLLETSDKGLRKDWRLVKSMKTSGVRRVVQDWKQKRRTA